MHTSSHLARSIKQMDFFWLRMLNMFTGMWEVHKLLLEPKNQK